ncbi:hypothetical protein ACFSMY_19130 [Streptomyces narbonensis]
MATVIDPPRRFHVYLAEDLAHCVGAWEGRVNEQAPRTATWTEVVRPFVYATCTPSGRNVTPGGPT